MIEPLMTISMVVGASTVPALVLQVFTKVLRSSPRTTAWLVELLRNEEDRTARLIVGVVLIVSAVLILLIIGVASLCVFLLVKGVTLGWAMVKPQKEIMFVAIAMMLGMLGNYPFTIWGNEKHESFSLKKFLRPMFVAPIVFVSVWQSVGKGEINLITYLLAYQNGFFWNTVLRSTTILPDSQSQPRGAASVPATSSNP